MNSRILDQRELERIGEGEGEGEEEGEEEGVEEGEADGEGEGEGKGRGEEEMWDTSGAEADRGLLRRWKPRVPSGPIGMRNTLEGTERRLSALNGLERPDWGCTDETAAKRRLTHGLWESGVPGSEQLADFWRWPK